VFFYWLKDRATKFRTVPNSKLEQLEAVFMEHQGEVYKGDAAWRHLDGVAGPTMALFLEKYVHRPLQSLFNDASPALPDFTASLHGGNITLSVGGELLHIIRSSEEIQSDDPEFPEGAADQMPGP
jgi:hypothetical protein